MTLLTIGPSVKLPQIITPDSQPSPTPDSDTIFGASVNEESDGMVKMTMPLYQELQEKNISSFHTYSGSTGG